MGYGRVPVGFFDRFRRAPQSFEALRAPWGERPSIHDFLRAAARPDGTLPDDCELPDTRPPDDGLRWAPGALDGVMSHHAGPPDGAKRAAAIAELVAELTRKPSDRSLRALQERVDEGPLLDCVDDLVSAVGSLEGLDADRVHDLGHFLATRAADREMVKLGVVLLGLLEGPDDREVLLTLGAHDELTLFAIVAMLNRPDMSERDLWTLAQRARGWGRIQSVERLADTSDPAIRAWMLREGFRNVVMDEYLAHVCATSGRLAHALEGDVDEALLSGASGLFEALVNGGPAPDLTDYDEGAVAAERFLDHVAARAEAGDFELEWLGGVVALRDFVTGDRMWPPLEVIGWTAEHREGLAKVASAILDRPEWEEAIEAALDSEAGRWRGEHLARMLGLDTFERLAARLEGDPVDGSAWFDLMRQVDSAQRLDRAMAIAEQLPLEAIATGPAEELGLGADFAPHGCLDMILQELDRFPGRGWPLLAAALRSPVVRNRNMAIRALAGWPRADWPPAAEAALEAARDAEPVADVRERIEAALAGQPLD